jgi:hypothetical protein
VRTGTWLELVAITLHRIFVPFDADTGEKDSTSGVDVILSSMISAALMPVNAWIISVWLRGTKAERSNEISDGTDAPHQTRL